MPKIIVGDRLLTGQYSQHSVYKNVCNFSTLSGNLIALVKQMAYFAPNSIYIEGCNISTVKNITVSEKEIIVGKHCLARKTLDIENSKLCINKLTFHQALLGFKEACVSQFPEKSLAFLLAPEREQFFQSAFDRAFVQQMKFAFSFAQKGNLLACAKNMKGFGFGLTPSGDDFNAGLLFGLSILEIIENWDYSKLKLDILEISKTNNLISNALLTQACEGKFFARLKNLLDTIGASPHQIHKAFLQMLAYGSTSSGDLLTGLLFVVLSQGLCFHKKGLVHKQ